MLLLQEYTNTKNGTAYYAKLDKDDAGKLVYGDKKSTRNGYRAKIKRVSPLSQPRLLINKLVLGRPQVIPLTQI